MWELFFHYHILQSEKSSCSLRGFFGISCCCLLLRIPANVCIIMCISSSLCILLGGFCMAFPSDVLGWFPSDGRENKEKLSPSVWKNDLTICAGVYWHGKVLSWAISLGITILTRKNNLMKLFIWISMKCNSSYTLIISLQGCLNSLIYPWQQVPLSSQKLWPHICRGLWSWWFAYEECAFSVGF